MHRPDRVTRELETTPLGLPVRGDRSAAVFVIKGEIERETCVWLEVLARLRLEAGWTVVTIDCSSIQGPSGHLLGALRRLARVAVHYGATVGVVTDTSVGELIRGHAASLITASTLDGLLETLNAVSEAHPIRLIGPRAEPAIEDA